MSPQTVLGSLFWEVVDSLFQVQDPLDISSLQKVNATYSLPPPPKKRKKKQISPRSFDSAVMISFALL